MKHIKYTQYNRHTYIHGSTNVGYVHHRNCEVLHLLLSCKWKDTIYNTLVVTSSSFSHSLLSQSTIFTHIHNCNTIPSWNYGFLLGKKNLINFYRQICDLIMNGPDWLQNYNILQGKFSQNFTSGAFPLNPPPGASINYRHPPWTPLTTIVEGKYPLSGNGI
jgi:hypothetical protein